MEGNLELNWSSDSDRVHEQVSTYRLVVLYAALFGASDYFDPCLEKISNDALNSKAQSDSNKCHFGKQCA